jgi:putative thioredoxin
LRSIIERGAAAIESGDLGGASQDFALVLQSDPGHPGALAGLARVWLKAGDIDKAVEILAQVPADRSDDPAVESVRAALELAGAAPADDSVTAGLRDAVNANPADLQARFDLAEALLANGDQAGSADQLLAITALDREWNEQAARTLLLKIFEAAGPMSEVARDGRRRLSSILFA